MSGFSNGQMIKPESGHLKFIWPHIYFFIFPRARKRSPLFHTEERPPVLWIFEMRFWNLSSVLWITEWGLLRFSVCSGSPQAFDPARCYLSTGGPSQENSAFLAGWLLCVSFVFLKRHALRMVESQVVSEGGKEAVFSLEVAAP